VTNLISDRSTPHTSHLTPIPPPAKPSAIMSAPNPGRQSPEPETQSSAQIEAPESGKIDAAPSTDHAAAVSEDTKQNVLSSNPVGPMEDAAHEKVSKEGRGNV